MQAPLIPLNYPDDPIGKAARDADLEWLFFVVSAWQHAQRAAKLDSAEPGHPAPEARPNPKALPPAFAEQWSELMQRLSPVGVERRKTKGAA